jgi:hypothetical protein
MVFHHKDHGLMLFKEILPFYTENHMKPINTKCSVSDCTHSYHSTLKYQCNLMSCFAECHGCPASYPGGPDQMSAKKPSFHGSTQSLQTNDSRLVP